MKALAVVMLATGVVCIAVIITALVFGLLIGALPLGWPIPSIPLACAMLLGLYAFVLVDDR